MNTVVLVLLFLLAFSPFVLSIPPNTTPYYKLALQWAYSTCSSISGPRCSPPYPSIHTPHRFTIHGLWPDFHPRSKVQPPPANCSNIPYTPIRDQNQFADMNRYWPNVVNQNDNVWFWTRQWGKHSTCALPQLTQQEFFNRALDLVKSLQLDANILGGAGRLVIGGSNNINVSLLIQQTIGVLPEVVCNKNITTKKRQLFEVRVCYDTAQNKINCPFAFNNCLKTYELPM